jgi:hypothetical protein
MSMDRKVLLTLPALALLAPSALAEEPVPAAVRAAIEKQLRQDDAEARDCDRGTLKLDISPIALDEAHSPAYEVRAGGSCLCGAVNCPEWVYRRDSERFVLLLKDSGFGLEAASESHHGWRDVIVSGHSSALVSFHNHHQFDGRRYRLVEATVENMDTGETKPAQRPIRFAHGASSAEYRGKITRGFPDTYTVRARAGQTMAVRITGQAQLSLMQRTGGSLLADATDHFEGKLPADGEYWLTVDSSGEEPSEYRMTVEIR